MHPLERFGFAAFEGADAVDDGSAPASELRQELESLVMERLLPDGLPGVEALVEELNGVGHAFAPRPSSPGWSSWFQTTNAGTRHFYIHVERGELSSVMLLYEETLEATVERRRAEKLSWLDGRFVAADENIPLLVLHYLEGGAAPDAPTSTR